MIIRKCNCSGQCRREFCRQRYLGESLLLPASETPQADGIVHLAIVDPGRVDFDFEQARYAPCLVQGNGIETACQLVWIWMQLRHYVVLFGRYDQS